IHKNLRKNFKRWEEIDEQIIMVEIHKNGQNIVIVGVYASSNDADVEIKDPFYIQLDNVLSKVRRDKEVLFMGDLNGRVGVEENDSFVRKFGETTTNDMYSLFP
ncbi:hypothetical protein HHI36_016131, partial [Cryptolaemus montrouzieri]